MRPDLEAAEAEAREQEIGYFTGNEPIADPFAKHSYAVKDSGKRQEFDGGMVRDTEEGKLDFTNLFQHFEPMGTRYAAHMTKGREKYPDSEVGVPNWTLADADPELVERFKRSAARHFKQWLSGETDEDHAAAVVFNINGAEYVEGMIRANRDYDRLREDLFFDEEGKGEPKRLIEAGEGKRPERVGGWQSGDRVKLSDVRVRVVTEGREPLEGEFFPEIVTLTRPDIITGWWRVKEGTGYVVHETQIEGLA